MIILKNSNLEIKNIFISHSHNDKKFVEEFVDRILVNGLGIDRETILCTSTDGTKIKTGDDWRETIKGTIKNAKIIILIITPNYKESEICQNEMGAAWAVDGLVFPVLVPPINYKTVGVLQEIKHFEKINDEKSLDELKDNIQKELTLKNPSTSNWTTQKKKFIGYINEFIIKNPFPEPLTRNAYNDVLSEKDQYITDYEQLNDDYLTIKKKYEELEKKKDKKDIDDIERKFSDATEWENFLKYVRDVANCAKTFSKPVLQYIYQDMTGEHANIDLNGYGDEISEAFSRKILIDEDDPKPNWSGKKLQKLKGSFDTLCRFMEKKDLTEDFYNRFDEEYHDVEFDFRDMDFWKEVININI